MISKNESYRTRETFDAAMLGTFDSTWLGGNAKVGRDGSGNPQVTATALYPFDGDAYVGTLRVTFEWDGDAAFRGIARMAADDALDHEFTVSVLEFTAASREGIERGIRWMKGLLKTCERISMSEDDFEFAQGERESVK